MAVTIGNRYFEAVRDEIPSKREMTNVSAIISSTIPMGSMVIVNAGTK